MPYPREPEHTSTSGPAKHPTGGPEPPGTQQIAANSRKIRISQNCREGRGADRQPALLAVESNRSLWELVERRQFVGWRYAPNPDGAKPKKPPINPHTGKYADDTDPETWGTFTEAERATTRYGLAGVGFVFTPTDPYAGVDLDNCRNSETGELEEWAERVVNAFDSYAEVSPSGTGVKIICRGRLPEWAGNRRGSVEVYDQGQYFTLTGRALEPGKPIRGAQRKLEALCRKLWPEPEENPTPHSPGPVEPVDLDDEELLEQARRARNGRKFTALFDQGETTRYRSRSEADMDLCGLLAFWTNRDAERMDRLFRLSALMRQKWEREDYRRRTIERAIAGCKSGYAPRPPVNPAIAKITRKLKVFAAKDPWTGKGGPTDRRAFGALLNTGGGYGRLRKDGIEVCIAGRDIAPDIGRTRSNAAKSLERLEARRLVKVLDHGNAKRPMKILIRYSPQTGHIEENPPEPPPVFNMDRLGGLLFKVRNPAPEMPEYDRHGRRIPRGSSPLVSPLGGLRALIVEKIAWSPEGLSASQIAAALDRRPDKIKPLLPALLEFGLIVEASGVYRAPADLLERLELELERSGCNEAERRDRRRYETDREARRRFVRERIEASESPGPTPEPEPVITNVSDPDQFRELAALLRSGAAPSDSESRAALVHAQRTRRNARRLQRKLDQERGGYERRKDGARMSPAAFLRSELRGVSGMGYPEMLRRWKAMGGKPETLEGAISAGPYRLKREPLDFNRTYVYPGVALVKRGAA